MMVREFSSGDTITAQRLNCYVHALDNLCQRVRALQGGQATAYLGRVYHPRVSWGSDVYVHRVPLNLRQFEYVGIQSCKNGEYEGFTEQVVLCGLVMRTSGSGDRTTVKTLAITEIFTPLFMQGCKIGLRDCMEGKGTHYVPECVAVLAEKDGGRRWELCKKRICQMPSYFNGSYLRSQPYDFHERGSYASVPSSDGNIALHVRMADCRWAIAGVNRSMPCVSIARCVHCVCVNFILPQQTTPYYIAYAGSTSCAFARCGMKCAYLWGGEDCGLCLPMCKHALFSTGRGGASLMPSAPSVTFPEGEGTYVQTWKDSIYPVGYGYYSANHRRPIVSPFTPILSKPEWSVEYYSRANSVRVLCGQSRSSFTVCWQTYTSACSREPLCGCKVEYVTQQDVYLSQQGFAPASLFKPYT